MYRFRVTILYFTIMFEQDGEIPEYKSSGLRGGMGQVLMDQYCVGNREACGKCPYQKSCIVQSIMYAPFLVKPNYVTEYESAGYSISCLDTRNKVCAGDEMTFRVILFGNTVAYINPILQAFYELGRRGLGKNHISYSIQRVENCKGQKIVEDGMVDLMMLNTQTAMEYINNRLEMTTWHEKMILNIMSPIAIKKQGKILVDFEIEKYSVPRYSNRKNEKVELVGISGWIELSGVQREFLKLLLAGELAG